MENLWNSVRSLFLAPIAAGTIAWLIWFALTWLLSTTRSAPEKALAQYTSRDKAQKNEGEAAIGSREYKIRLAAASLGLNVAGWENLALYLAFAAAGLALLIPGLLLGLPPVLVLGLPFLGGMMVQAYVEAQWEKVKLDFEKEIPVMLNRLSSLLKTNLNVIEALDSIANGLDPEKPLKGWISGLAHRLQNAGRGGLVSALKEAELISPSLLLAVTQIGRLWETGGKGYSDALRLTAGNLADLLEIRAQASAVAEGAWGTTRTILLALSFTLGMVLLSPVSKPYFSTPLMQLALLLTLLWGSLGYWNIRDSINEVLE